MGLEKIKEFVVEEVDSWSAVLVVLLKTVGVTKNPDAAGKKKKKRFIKFYI